MNQPATPPAINPTTPSSNAFEPPLASGLSWLPRVPEALPECLERCGSFAGVARLALAFKSEVILMRVSEEPLHEGSPEYEQIVRGLNRFADRLAEEGVTSTRLHIASGPPAETILEAVEEQRVEP